MKQVTDETRSKVVYSASLKSRPAPILLSSAIKGSPIFNNGSSTVSLGSRAFPRFMRYSRDTRDRDVILLSCIFFY